MTADDVSVGSVLVFAAGRLLELASPLRKSAPPSEILPAEKVHMRGSSRCRRAGVSEGE
jgi:hypothetical protein